MLIYRTAGGGGWKDRLDRPVEAVERDVAFGLVSAEKALARTAWSWATRRRRTAERARQKAERGDALGVRLRAAARGGDRATARRRRGCRRRSRRSRCAGRRWRTASPRWRGRAMAETSAGRRASATAPRSSSSTSTCGFTDPSSPLACDLDDVLVRVPRLLDAARARGRAGLLHHDRLRRGRGGRGGGLPAQGPGAEGVRPGTRWVEIDARLGRRESEPIIAKAHASAFFGVPFAAMLAGRDTLIVCGASTSGCVRATVVDAMQHGFVADRATRVRRRPLSRRTSRRWTRALRTCVARQCAASTDRRSERRRLARLRREVPGALHEAR